MTDSKMPGRWVYRGQAARPLRPGPFARLRGQRSDSIMSPTKTWSKKLFLERLEDRDCPSLRSEERRVGKECRL